MTRRSAYAKLKVMMKLRTTTPASLTRYARKNAKRVSYLFVALIVAVAMVAGTQLQPVAADQYDEKIKALQADMSRYQAEADRLNAESNTLSNALAQITNEKNALQAQINVNQAQHDKLVGQIADTQKQIQENQDALGSTLADLYVGDDVSPVEMLASSQNIGDFLDKQEYRNSVKDELGATIKKVKTLKEQLTAQQEEVAKVLDQQKQARDSLTAKESEQATLLAQTKNDEANYQGMIKDSQAQIAEARATQAAISARYAQGGASMISFGGSDYPWNSSNCPMVSYFSTGGADGDGADGWGYGCRQCASYVAWRIHKETGEWYKWGNAKDFTYSAIAAGYKNLGMNPEAGSIAVMDPAKAGQSYGHVAWVESAYGDRVVISQYNANINGIGYGMYTKVDVSKYSFDHYVKIK